jgi:translocation and assembly module TamB
MERMPDDAIIQIQSEGSGTFQNPTIKLTGKIMGGTFKGRDMGPGSINAGIQNRKILLNAALFNEKVKLTGSGDFNDILPWTAEIDIQQGNYDFIISSILKDVPEDLNFNLEGHVTMRGDRHNFRAGAEIDHLSLSLFELSFFNYNPIRFTINNRKLSLLSCAIKSGTTSFSLQGGLEIGKEYDLSLNGSSSLAPLKGMSKKIGYLKGDAEFIFSLKGQWDAPEMKGGMNLSDASFGMRDYPLYISSIDGYLYIDGDRIVLENLDGQVGGGDVRISGVLYLKKFNIKRFYVESKFGDISTNISKDFNIKFAGNILYKGTPDDQSITGDIRIIKARYREMVEWRSWFLTVKTKEVQRTELSALERAKLNIRVTAGESMSIDNNIARAPVRIPGEMIVKGTLVNPILFGRLESTDGYVYFRNNEFRLISASADFADPNRIKPLINITAETTVQGYSIRLSLEGQTDRFDLSLSSDPHLEEVDILSLLTVGQRGKQLQGLEGGIGAGAATSFITGKVQDVIEERLRSIVGVDRFQVEPHVSTETSAVEPWVTVSKRLIGDKLFVTYSNSLGSTQEQVIKLEYLIDKNVSLIGIRDDKGSVGGDIKFRFGFK